jgi:hypothetical protein
MDRLKTKVTQLELESCFLLPENKKEIPKYQDELDQMEQQLQCIEQFLDSELEEMEKGKGLLESLEKQNQFLVHVLSRLRTSSQEQPQPRQKRPEQALVTPVKQKSPLITAIAPVTPEEFKTIPSYALSRMTIQKLNQHINELNVYFKDKYSILHMQPTKMAKWQRNVLQQQKECGTDETKGLAFITEKELQEKHSWTKSQFVVNAVGRNVIAILRSLGRIKEVRGSGQNRICIT